jgi:hypothetical protein
MAGRNRGSKGLIRAIAQLQDAAHKRRDTVHGTPEYQKAAAEEMRLNDLVMRLAREGG